MTAPVTPDALEHRLMQFLHTHRSTHHRYFLSIGMFNGHPHMLFDIRHTPGMTQKELAQRLRISPASVAISIRRLEAAGLIERRRDGQDSRAWHLYLTPAGEELDAACAHGREFMVDALFRGFSAEEMQTLDRLLARMTDNLRAAGKTLPEDEFAPPPGDIPMPPPRKEKTR